MEKKQYIIPHLEVTNLGTLGRWMKELGPESLPDHMAPAQRTDKAY